ncbi:helix-turn-helix domain-containing protein [Carboxylicivirga sp. N1Y90]|uniref:helix-turn-helix domain-containing protein n=1 Tax=Carboxylicivirga fragile TaxID=3417571 RepID=UPI003D33F312|nr:AraC family transcriptional regulator [Marinilabiliaceae bacterium N1Y90]
MFGKSDMILSLTEILVFSFLLMLSFILIANPMKVNVKANRWFGLLLLLWASYWFDEVYGLISHNEIEISSYIFVAFIQFLAPPIFYISICYFAVPAYKVSSNISKLLLLPTIYLMFILANWYFSLDMYWAKLGLILINAFTFITLSFLKIRRHQKNIQQFASSTQEINLNWLEYIIIAIVVLVVAVSVFNLVFFTLPLNGFMNVMVLLVVLFITYYSLRQTEIFPKNKAEVKVVVDINAEEQNEEPKRQVLSDDKVVEIKAQLDSLMERKSPYLDSELTLMKLAQLLNITSHQLSYVINKGYSENFFQFVNRFRIEKAKRMLADKKNEKLSILGVAFESGFSSKTSFNTTFKKMTEQTPSEYKKKCSGL